jgi:hypothetical protein
MSTSFVVRLGAFLKYIFDGKYSRNISNKELAFRFGALSTLLVGHGVYTFSTEKTDAIIVRKKYKMNRGGYTDFMIIDDKDRHFNVNNSFWYWKWNSNEDWHKIEEKTQIFIKYYGWRVPVFGLFPNIVISNKREFLDSLTSAEYIKFASNNFIILNPGTNKN